MRKTIISCDECSKVIDQNKWFEERRADGTWVDLCSLGCLQAYATKHQMMRAEMIGQAIALFNL